MARQTTPSRTRKNSTSLSENAIIDVAERIVRRDGVAGLTIKGLCDELGVTPPSIYWHVANKSAVIDALIVRIVNRLEIPPLGTMGGWDRMRAFFVDVYRVVGKYPGMASVMARMPPQRSGLDNMVTLAAGLQADGVDEEGAFAAIYTTLIHVAGHLVYREAMLQSGGDDEPVAVRPLEQLTHDLLQSVPDDPQYAAIRRYTEAHSRQANVRFEWGLDRLIAGIRAELSVSKS